MIYDSPTSDVPLSQGDLIDGCPLFRQLATAEVIDLNEMPAGWLSRVIVLTQACDLAHAKTSKVLVAAVHDAAELVQKGILKASLVRDQVRRGLVYGWYFLPRARPDPRVRVDRRSARRAYRIATSSRTPDRSRPSSRTVRYAVPRTSRPAFHRHLCASACRKRSSPCRESLSNVAPRRASGNCHRRG